ncbi:predicted protein [Streptomyces pristinaespiralis ATCC 25486]|uniref:Predicted protein n=1 Tax=Streptomyces pristinaespiralis (strain ATCC 25486 / DSM 40338 / CBS 914.69 / JCM 4507 / KCC S-0507 / NBRC 13074 / NRRL 2958 / 5647) TaxID=457429 RepID=B5HGP3_STRE2|nr:predicted protein [Streptomyces pristinaespiralis ATCC 25486]
MRTRPVPCALRSPAKKINFFDFFFLFFFFFFNFHLHSSTFLFFFFFFYRVCLWGGFSPPTPPLY